MIIYYSNDDLLGHIWKSKVKLTSHDVLHLFYTCCCDDCNLKKISYQQITTNKWQLNWNNRSISNIGLDRKTENEETIIIDCILWMKIGFFSLVIHNNNTWNIKFDLNRLLITMDKNQIESNQFQIHSKQPASWNPFYCGFNLQ